MRHLPVEQAYVNKSIPTKHAVTGEVISSASQPGVVAEILEQLQVLPGHNVLEIGAGTGYNAALLAELVGETGQVVSLDIDEDIVEGAKENLQRLGISNVRVERADGYHGFAPLAPYDRIVLSTSSPDVFPAWTSQLRANGRLGLAMLFFDDNRTFIVFEKHEGYLQSCGGVGATFMPMRGDARTESSTNQDEAALRQWIEQGKMFSKVLVHSKGINPEGISDQIVLRRAHSTFVFERA